MPIYTKTGDRGKTSLGSGRRIWKDDIRVNTYGTIDELNAHVGLARAELMLLKTSWAKKLSTLLETIQQDLFNIGSYLANTDNTWLLEDLLVHTQNLEKEIDTMTEPLPPLTNFILPGEGKIGAQFHVTRTVARRAERQIVTLLKKEEVEESVIKYVNRLSDVFFTMARFANFKQKKRETQWSHK